VKPLLELEIPPDLPPEQVPYLLGHAYLGPPAARHLNRRRLDLVDSLLPDEPGGPVLDIGCGWGLNVLTLQSRGHEALGLDLEWDAFPAARRVALHNGYEPAFVQGDAGRLPFGDGTFAAVTSIETWEHVYREDRPRVLAEIHRILRPDGILCLSTPNATGLVETGKRVGLALPVLGRRLGSMMMVPSRDVPRGDYHPHRYHLPERAGILRRRLGSAGFRIEALTRAVLVLRDTPGWALPAARALESLVERLPLVRGLCSTLVIRARRESTTPRSGPSAIQT
jgi:SAM-dependent methyltransferase